VLDLACGNGEAALAFAAAGCAVVGVDRSAAMLEIARGKARDSEHDISFVQGDIRNLATTDYQRLTIETQELDWRSVVGRRSSVDLATCFSDSVNYLIGEGDLACVFGGVVELLRPGGYLIFDMNTQSEYASWDERDTVIYDRPDCLVYNKLSYDPTARLATGRIVWFVREVDRWWRGEETHTERAWSDAEVRAALAGAGLGLVGRWDAEGNPLAEDSPGELRVVYVARRLSNEVDTETK
jgi:SAM-dependent methyltransferase